MNRQSQYAVERQKPQLKQINDIVSSVAPHAEFDPEVLEILLEIGDDFIESCTLQACNIAKHRSSSSLGVQDVQLHLKQAWQMKIPGFDSSTNGQSTINTPVQPPPSVAHRRRLQAIFKAKVTQAQQNDAKSNPPSSSSSSSSSKNKSPPEDAQLEVKPAAKRRKR